ncbi:MAG: alternative ribosome rescue aminoacyl-tRNA hydrolase ArfB [Planctomycetota bacterium]|nr:alternative ribosome rescue aminoacyl-tRNA hydrolase ArfB [Planctomycetota bacterium]
MNDHPPPASEADLPRDPRDRHRPGDAIELGRHTWADPSDLVWSFSRGGGPGGQHVNKTSSRAELRVALSSLGGIHPEAVERIRAQAGHLLIRSGEELRVTSDEHRSQMQNREACLARLRSLIKACEIRPKVRRKTKPTRGSRERRLKEKREHSEKKQNRRWRGSE